MSRYRSPFRKQTLHLGNSLAWAVKERLDEYPPGQSRRLKDFVELAVRNEVARQIEKLELVDQMLIAERDSSQEARDKISDDYCMESGHRARGRFEDAVAHTRLLLGLRDDQPGPHVIDVLD